MGWFYKSIKMHNLIPVMLLASLAACADSPMAVVESDLVRVVEEPSGIRITNLTDSPLAYMASDPEWLALVDATFDLMALCSTPDAACLRLPAKGSVLVPYAEVGGFGTSTTRIVVWTWRVVPSSTPGEYQTSEFKSVTLEL